MSLMYLYAMSPLFGQSLTPSQNAEGQWVELFMGLAIGVAIGVALMLVFRVILGPPAPPTTILPDVKPVTLAKPSAEPLRLLALLQREGRFIDFMLEDLSGVSDAQIGASVRDIQQKCQKALREYLVLEPVIDSSEGEKVEIPAGFDPSAIRLTGNVSGQGPFTGTLQHHGWRVKEIRLDAPPEGQDLWILTPAEVEV